MAPFAPCRSSDSPRTPQLREAQLLASSLPSQLTCWVWLPGPQLQPLQPSQAPCQVLCSLLSLGSDLSTPASHASHSTYGGKRILLDPLLSTCHLSTGETSVGFPGYTSRSRWHAVWHSHGLLLPVHTHHHSAQPSLSPGAFSGQLWLQKLLGRRSLFSPLLTLSFPIVPYFLCHLSLNN